MVNHEKAVIKCKQKLTLKDSAKKVMAAIQEKSTNSVTGGDMASLIKAIQTNDLFKNKLSVSNIINQRNEIVNTLISKLNKIISDYKQQEADIPQSHIPTS